MCLNVDLLHILYMEEVSSYLPTFFHLLGKFVGKSSDLFVPEDTILNHALTLGGLFIADMKKFSTNSTDFTSLEAEDRTALVASPFLLFNIVSLVAQATGIFISVAFKYAAKNILVTVKSFLIRTILLGLFFFVLIPLGKLFAIKTGLLLLSPSIISRAGEERSGDMLAVESMEDLLEFFVSEIYKLGESFVDDIDSFVLS